MPLSKDINNYPTLLTHFNSRKIRENSPLLLDWLALKHSNATNPHLMMQLAQLADYYSNDIIHLLIMQADSTSTLGHWLAQQGDTQACQYYMMLLIKLATNHPKAVLAILGKKNDQDTTTGCALASLKHVRIHRCLIHLFALLAKHHAKEVLEILSQPTRHGTTIGHYFAQHQHNAISASLIRLLVTLSIQKPHEVFLLFRIQDNHHMTIARWMAHMQNTDVNRQLVNFIVRLALIIPDEVLAYFTAIMPMDFYYPDTAITDHLMAGFAQLSKTHPELVLNMLKQKDRYAETIGHYMTHHTKNTVGIRLFLQTLTSLSKRYPIDVLELLGIKNIDGMTVSCEIAWRHHSNTLQHYIALLSRLFTVDAQATQALLAHKNTSGYSMSHYVLLHDEINVIINYTRLLDLCGSAQLQQLFLSICKEDEFHHKLFDYLMKPPTVEKQAAIHLGLKHGTLLNRILARPSPAQIAFSQKNTLSKIFKSPPQSYLQQLESQILVKNHSAKISYQSITNEINPMQAEKKHYHALSLEQSYQPLFAKLPKVHINENKKHDKIYFNL